MNKEDAMKLICPFMSKGSNHELCCMDECIAWIDDGYVEKYENYDSYKEQHGHCKLIGNENNENLL